MAVKILITRKLKDGVAVDTFLSLNKLRCAAMEQPGYISGETLVGLEEPNLMVVLSVWDSLEHWQVWKNSHRRREIEASLEPLLATPAEYHSFQSGAR